MDVTLHLRECSAQPKLGAGAREHVKGGMISALRLILIVPK
jgi:hypothetical protein